MYRYGPDRGRLVGRAADSRPPNRFERVELVECREQQQHEADAGRPRLATVLLPDESRTLIRPNDSPDLPFRYTINPYRGCEHGCAYCYARPGHETLAMNAGIDFETKILVKYDAPRLLRDELSRPAWQGDVIVMSGVTDCYQPIERRLKLTRSCLEVLNEARQGVVVITKNVLILRDLDLLAHMSAANRVHVNISLTTLNAELAGAMEPRTATPAARLRAIRQLAEAGVPVAAMLAPVIPGLNDHELPELLAAARDAGAGSAGFQLLRLPLSVAPVFLGWLSQRFPLARDRVENLIRSTRDGRLNQPQFGCRMRGEGPYADGIGHVFRVFASKYKLAQPLPSLDCSQFRRPSASAKQLRLF